MSRLCKPKLYVPSCLRLRGLFIIAFVVSHVTLGTPLLNTPPCQEGLEDGPVAVDEDGRLLGVGPVDLRDLATTLQFVSHMLSSCR